MKRTTKQIKIATLLLLLTLAFLYTFTITYAYFTSVVKIGGSGNFYDLNCNFRYYKTSSVYTDVTNTSTIPLIASSAFQRGGVSKLKENITDTTDLLDIRLYSDAESCNSFVRFWIDVYLVDGDGTEITTEGDENYAQYFTLGSVDSSGNFTVPGYITRYKNENTGVVTYYYNYAFQAGSTITLFNSIKMAEDLPNSLLGSQMCINLSFEAVQQANKAYLSVFDDSHGYLESWGEIVEE